MGYKFGDKLFYNSPVRKGLRTECVFIRDDNGRAVIIFSNDEWVVRANYNLLSRQNNVDHHEIQIEEFGCKSGKTSYIVSKAAEFANSHIPFLMISNEDSIIAITNRLKLQFEDQFCTSSTEIKWDGCYILSKPGITPDEIYNLCEMYVKNFGIEVLLFDYIRNTDPSGYVDNSDRTINTLEQIVEDFGIDVISVKQAQQP